MVNKNYAKGRRKEYSIIDKERKEFDIIQRSKGSHSPIDIFAINKEKKVIRFIQSKPDNYSASKVKKLMDKYSWLSGSFKVEYVK